MYDISKRRPWDRVTEQRRTPELKPIVTTGTGRPIFSEKQILSPTEIRRGMVLKEISHKRTLELVVLSEEPFRPTETAGLWIKVWVRDYNFYKDISLADRSVVAYPNGWWNLYHYLEACGQIDQTELAKLES